MDSTQPIDYYPSSAFYFKVIFGELKETTDAFFQEVSVLQQKLKLKPLLRVEKTDLFINYRKV